MGLSLGMGQDGILLHWARWDGAKLTARDLNETMDRILIDVHAERPGFLTVEHYGADLELHALDGSVLARGEPGPADDDEHPPSCDYGCGFVDVDADTVIASTEEDGGHWLLDARTPELRGAVRYPGGPVDAERPIIAPLCGNTVRLPVSSPNGTGAGPHDSSSTGRPLARRNRAHTLHRTGRSRPPLPDDPDRSGPARRRPRGAVRELAAAEPAP
ncbi:hypothetical protein AB0B01_22510 [Streptomyces sp. NPDC044571]|uniref:hypothetical protein n=1 Tax=Streptomyces sp. NPDC044571 TaxID=3155371 RepID=UPI0033C38C59